MENFFRNALTFFLKTLAVVLSISIAFQWLLLHGYNKEEIKILINIVIAICMMRAIYWITTTDL